MVEGDNALGFDDRDAQGTAGGFQIFLRYAAMGALRTPQVIEQLRAIQDEIRL
jgi:hypothetical protein